jgi:arylsulfatase A-like enzyme
MERQNVNKALKSTLLIIILLISGLLVLHVLNFVRLGTNAFGQSARLLIDRSRHIRNLARPGYQSEALSRMAPNPNNGTYFLFDDLLNKAAVLEKPSAVPQRKVSGPLFSFEFDDPGRPNLTPAMGKSALRLKNGIAVIEQKNPDYLTNEMPIEIPTHNLGEIVIRARVNKGTQMVLAWSQVILDKNLLVSNQDRLWRKQVNIDLIADNAFHTYMINAKEIVKRNLKTDETIKQILLRPSLVDGAIVEIDFIRFLPTYAKFFEQINGKSYEVIGNEMRPVLYMLSPQVLEFLVTVPASAFLDFGNAILLDNEPMDFQVSVTDDLQTWKIYSNKLTNSSKWHDARLDLSKWGGRNVRLTFRVGGSQRNVAFWSNPLLSSRPTQRFNVIIILEDALRADHLSINGNRLPTSPVKDKLFKDHGIVFENAVSQAPWTRPSIPSLMTSLLPTVTGVWHFSDMLPDEFLTLPEIMRSQGFATAAFIQNPNAGPWAGNHQGYGQLFDEVKLGLEPEGIFGDRLREWLGSHYNRNFFLYLHVHNPAGPYDPPPPFDRWYREAPSGGTAVQRRYMDPEFVKRPTKEGRRLLYDGEICHNDSLLPILLETLEALNIERDTLLVFVADHGEHLGEHGLWGHCEPGFIETIHAPINLVYPARFHNSKRISQTVQLIDVMPTILELAGVDTSNLLLQGDSLLDLIEGRRLSYWDNRITVSEETYEMSTTAKKPRLGGSIFYRNWHLISSKSLFKGSWLLPAVFRLKIFDFKNDRDENHASLSFLPDLYIKYRFARILNDLQSNDMQAWEKWTGEKHERMHKLDPDTRDRLKALGYIK